MAVVRSCDDSAGRPETAARVIAAVVLYTARFGLLPVVMDLWSGPPWWAAHRHASRLFTYVVVTALFAFLAYGLWRAWGLARVLVLLIVAANLISGTVPVFGLGWWWVPWWLVQVAAVIAIVALLTRPSARAWFARPAVSAERASDTAI